MMRSRRILQGLLVLTAVAWAAPARAGVALGLGADAVVDPGVGEFQLTLATETPLARSVTLGARFGALFMTEPTRVGVPLDLRLRGRFGRVYLDGLVGPWLVFKDGDVLRFHGAVGFGLLTRSYSFGLEVGVLDQSALIGVRLALPL